MNYAIFQSMQSYHPTDGPGHDVLEAAVDSMVGIAMYINEMKRRHELLLRTQELQNMISGSPPVDLASCGDLVLEVSF